MAEENGVKLRKLDGQVVEIHPEDVSKAIASGKYAWPDRPQPSIRGPLTFAERAKRLGIQTARALPEMAGFLGGGLIGGSLAGPPGAIGGAGLGAGLGKAAEIGLRNIAPGLMGGSQSYEGFSPGTEIALSMAFGGAGEGVGQVASKVLPSLFSRNVSPNVMERITRLRGEGVPVTAGDYRVGSAAQQIEGLLRGTMLGGRIIAEKDLASANALNAWRTRLVRQLGSDVDKIKLGGDIKEAVGTRSDQLNAMFKDLYGRLSFLHPAKIDPMPIRTWAESEYKRIAPMVSAGKGLPSAHSKQSPSRYIDIIDDLQHFGQVPVRAKQDRKTVIIGYVDVPLTYNDVWQVKKMVGGMIRSEVKDPLRTEASATLSKIYGLLDDSMEAGAQAVSPDAVVRVKKVNAAYAQAKELMERYTPIKNLRMEMSGTPDEKVIDTFFRRGSITPVKQLFKALPVGQRRQYINEARARVVDDLFSQATGEGEAGVVTLNTRNLYRNFHTMRDEFKNWLEPNQFENLKNFIEAAYQAGSSGRMLNPGAQRQMMALGQSTAAASAAGLLISGHPGLALGAGSVVISPAVLAKIMMNDKAAKLIAEGFKIPPGTAKSVGWLARMANVLRIIDEQEELGNNKITPSIPMDTGKEYNYDPKSGQLVPQ